MRFRALLITYTISLSPREIELFRGCIIRLVDGDELYHNHLGEGYAYRYPLIQYKLHRGKAAILAINEGIEALDSLLNAGETTVCLGERETLLTIDKVRPISLLVQPWEGTFHYRLSNWLALNSENYNRYQNLTSVVDRTLLLQNILTANILAMCKGIGVTLEKEVVCTITQIGEPRKRYYKGTPLMSFNLEFDSNVSLPDYIGLGKGVSIGYGTCISDNRNKHIR